MPFVWKPPYLQILEKLPSNPGHRGDHLPHSRVKHEKAVVGTRGAGSLCIPRACQTADRRDSDEGTPLKELCSGCALSNSQSGRWPTIATWTSFLCKSPAEIQYVGVLSIAVMQAFSETKFEYATVTNWVYNCSTTDLKANGSHPPPPASPYYLLARSWGLPSRQPPTSVAHGARRPGLGARPPPCRLLLFALLLISPKRSHKNKLS